MKRSTLDALISSIGLIVAILLFLAAGGLFYTYTFVHTQVHDQLATEKVVFPEAGSQALMALPPADRQAVSQYAGEQVLTGAQAAVFANHYIAVHLDKIGGGKTYAELSAASMADPSNQELAAKVETVFRGETLRGLLLNAYAFDTMAVVAKVAAFVSLVAGFIMLVLVALGFRHAKQTKKRRR